MISQDEYSRIAETMRATEKAMRVPVMISHDAVAELVVGQLMAKYRHPGNSEESKKHLKRVLMEFYLTADEFSQLS